MNHAMRFIATRQKTQDTCAHVICPTAFAIITSILNMLAAPTHNKPFKWLASSIMIISLLKVSNPLRRIKFSVSFQSVHKPTTKN